MAGGGLVIMLEFMIMLVPVSVTRRRRAALAVHPAGIAASIVFFLPDRHAMLHFVDDEAAGVEGLSAMRGTDTDPHGHIAQGQRADTVDAESVLDRKAPQGVGDDALAFLHRELLERFVFQASDFLPLIVIPNPPLEADIAACAQVEELAPRFDGIDGRLSKAKAHHPPATGGMKTTASPAASRRDQSLNSLLTAIFNCSRASVNPYRPVNSPYRSAGVAEEVSRVSSERPACSRIRA